jgi:pre-mRNA-splicing factor SPF27
VEAQQPLAGIDTVRFQLPPPKQGNNDYSAWRKAADNAYSQLEHQYNRLLNLELGVKYAPNAWRVHNEQLGGLVKRLQAEVQQLRQQQESLNKNRKLSQEAVHRQLKAKQAEYQGYVRKNLEIAGACAALEAEISTLSDR